MTFPNQQQSREVERRRSAPQPPASSSCKGQPVGALRTAKAPASSGHQGVRTTTQVTAVPLEGNWALLRLNYSKRPPGIWPKA